MLSRVFSSLVALSVIVLAGCTAPVEPPSLTRRNPLPIERIALGPELDRAAVLRIVEALGEQLDPETHAALKDAVETFFADDLSGFRDELSRAVLDEADDREGLLAAVERRASDPKSAETIRQWREKLSRPAWNGLVEPVLDLAASDDTALLMEKAAILLDPHWTERLPSFRTERDDRLPELFAEFAEAMSDVPTREKLAAALQRTLGGTAAATIFEAVGAAFTDGDGEAYAFSKALERAVKGRYEPEGFAASSGLEALLRLFETLDQPTGGLFEAA